MGPPNLGLVKMSYNDRFSGLLDGCKAIANNIYSKAASEAKSVVDNITDDLTKLEKRGDKELTENYKTSLIPFLENMYKKFKYFS